MTANMDCAKSTEEVSPGSDPRASVHSAERRTRSLTTISYVGNNNRTIPSQDRRTALGQIPQLIALPPDGNSERIIGPAAHIDLRVVDSALPAVSKRVAYPFPSHPFVTNANSLQAAVSENPNRILEAIQNLVNDRDGLRDTLRSKSAELRSMTEDLASTRIDHKAARSGYEELLRIANAKQVILWKYIESLQDQLAAAKGQPNPSLRSSRGPDMAMRSRRKQSMGVAMEKWITDEMDGDIVPRQSEEDSDQGTDRSVWSADDSLATKSLDPNAQAFIPQSGSPEKLLGRSPARESRPRSSDRDWDVVTPLSPTKFNSSCAVQSPLQGSPRGRPRNRIMQPPAKAMKSRAPPESLIAHLPPRWYGICPYSLASTRPCPLGVNCQFVLLCPNFNNESGNGCELYKKGGAAACRFAHEYRFCENTISEQPGGCMWENDQLGKHPATMKQTRKKEIHMKIRAHKSTCSVAEWEARVLLLSMREAHGRGIFNGR